MRWVLLAGAIATEVTASLGLQAAGGLVASPWLLLVAAGYSGSFICLARLLAVGVPIGVAYGIWGASGVALTAVMARILFDGPLTAVMGLGIVLIMFGVVAVEVGAQRARHRAPTGDEDAAA